MFKFFEKKEKEPENFKEILNSLRVLEKNVEELSGDLKKLKNRSKFFVQKVGIIRYNPFKNVGGDQSFSAAFLDEENSGLIITSLYSQTGNRIYGKQIINGQSSYSLSEEEEQAIKKAKQSD